MYNPFSLEGKTILVTGASSGIGRSIAVECSKVGARVVINGRNEERLNETFSQLENDSCLKIASDLTNKDDVAYLLENTPLLDGIVLCAGVTQTLPVRYLKEDNTEMVFKTNTLAPINLIQKLLKAKKISKNASVVFISSVAEGKPYFGNAIYSASKAAINSYSRVAAFELAQVKIRVNCIEPGIIMTKMVHDSVFTDDEMAQQEKQMPLGFGHVEDIAHGCIYLLSDAAKWVTGSVLKIDGGQTLL